MKGGLITWKIPWFTLVQISLAYGSRGEAGVDDLWVEVVGDDLFICGVEFEARRQVHALIHGYLSPIGNIAPQRQ